MSAQSNLPKGLNLREVHRLQLKHGANVMATDKKLSALRVLISQFTSPLIYILIFAAIVTWFLGDYTDTNVILAAVIINTTLGFYQEYKAQKSLAALSQVLSPQATVIRDSNQQEITAVDLVPGDYVILQAGDRIPADGVIVKHHNFTVNEAILTGESQPVSKKIIAKTANDYFGLFTPVKNRTDSKGQESVYLGTVVQSGRAEMIVVFTGPRTQVGQIADTLKSTAEVTTPLQIKIKRLSTQLAIIVAVTAAIILAIGFLTQNSFEEMFTLSVAVAVAAIPEGLAVSLTAILAIGMQRILKRKAIVRKLLAAEVLGSVTVICADKTGTLTEGKMKVTSVETNSQTDLVIAALIGNDLHDPLEVSMWEWAKIQVKKIKKYRSVKAVVSDHTIIDILPFNPKNRFAAKMTKDLVYLVGAPEVLLHASNLSNQQKKQWHQKIDNYAKQGFRLVGFATKKPSGKKLSSEVLSKSDWLGLMVFQDPIRPGVANALKKAQQAGIDIKVITGDYLKTAQAVMAQLGFHLNPDEIMEGQMLTNISKSDLANKLKTVKLFARTTPEQKLKIVTALQEAGQVVAMTGDGVNDAPALKKADIGIVVSTASDVSKETADMVLLDDNFATIIAAVEEGRGIFVNLRKVLVYLLAGTFSEVLIIVVALMLGLPLPITATQILWVNFIADGFPNLALTIEPKDKGLLKQPPIPKTTQLVGTRVKTIIGLVSTLTAAMSLSIFVWYYSMYSLEYARTMTFTVLTACSLLYVFSTRSLDRPIWLDNLFKNRWLVFSIFVGIVFHAAAIYLPSLQYVFDTIPLKAADWLVVAVSSLVIISIIEVVKWSFVHQIFKRQKLATT